MTGDVVRYALFAEVFAALAHPKRLEIIRLLASGEQTASGLAEKTGLSKANLSQHVNLLKVRGLVHCEKRKTFCHYRLTSPKVLETCELVRQLILDQMDLTTQYRKELGRVVPLRKKSPS